MQMLSLVININLSLSPQPTYKVAQIHLLAIDNSHDAPFSVIHERWHGDIHFKGSLPCTTTHFIANDKTNKQQIKNSNLPAFVSEHQHMKQAHMFTPEL